MPVSGLHLKQVVASTVGDGIAKTIHRLVGGVGTKCDDIIAT